MRTYLAAGVIIAVLVTGLAWWFLFAAPSTDSTVLSGTETPALAPEVEAVLAQKTALLATLIAEPSIVAAVRAANAKNATLSMADITRLDQEWQSAKTVTPFISSLLSNATAQRLIAFQGERSEFKEIFIADEKGLNVGQTDKTSDYFQADEAWWVNSYNNGRGATLHGTIEFDESSQTEAISVYVPVMDGTRAIGVVKGVLDLTAISSEL